MNHPAEGPKRVLIVCALDGYANGQKPVEIERFLRSLAALLGPMDHLLIALAAYSGLHRMVNPYQALH